MKKAIILSTAAAMFSIAVVAQDTIPKNNKDSLQNKMKEVDSSLNTKQKDPDKDSLNTGKTDTSSGNNTDTSNTVGLNGDSKWKNGADSTKKMNDTAGDVAMNQRKESKEMNDTTAAVVLTDRVMMKEEKVYLVKDGEITPLEKSYKIETGAIVSPEGKVKFPSGKMAQLKNGQFIELKPVEKPAGQKPAATSKKPAVKKKPNP
jgi:hypothetical protein